MMTPASTYPSVAAGDPRARPAPLPPTPARRWERAVEIGGRGHYAAAEAELAAVLRAGDAGALRSLAWSTRASFARQLGRHIDARGLDGRALHLADSDVVARCDALTGLAADALGVGRFALATALLDRVTTELDDPRAADHPRLRLRALWVRAETAMVAGRGPEALEAARTAVAHAAATDVGPRRRCKTAMVHAAALCSVLRVDDARRAADPALTDALADGLLPLAWALSGLLADIGSDGRSVSQLRAVQADTAAEITARGGRWATDAPARGAGAVEPGR